MEAKLQQEAELWQEEDPQHPEVNTTEEREGSRTVESEEEEARDEDNEKEGDKGMTTSGEEIDGPDEDVEQDNAVSNGDTDVDWDAVQDDGCGGSEAEEWESGGIDVGKEK